MEKRQIMINAMISVLQVTAIAGSLFILYRFLLNRLGIEGLGLWSVVMASTSVFSIFNFGLSASSLKFVAKYHARSQEKAVLDVIQTSAISTAAFMGVFLLFAYPLTNWLLHLVVPGTRINEALAILPYTLLSVWVMQIGGVFQAGLDGYHRIDLRNILLMGAAIFHLLLCFTLVPSYGLMGLAYASLAQSCSVLILGLLILRRYVPVFSSFHYMWDYKIFKEILKYALNSQTICFIQLLYEPITKMLLTRFGGLNMTGFYEMASRMIMQLRALLVSANQVIVPTIADLMEKNPSVIQHVYKLSYRLLFYIAVPYYCAVIALTPIFSRLWIGSYEHYFIFFSSLLAIGWLLNTLSAPSYFAYMGIGELRWNIIGHLSTGLLNLALGLLLANICGAPAVVIGWVLSLSIGSLVFPISYHWRYRIPLTSLVPRESVVLMVASVAALLIVFLSYRMMANEFGLLMVASINSTFFLAIIAFPFWHHPMRKKLIGWIINDFVRIQ